MLLTAFGTGADECAVQGGQGCAGTIGLARRMDEGSARTLCAVLLGGLFVGRTVKNFGRDFGWGQKVSVVTVKGTSKFPLVDGSCILIFPQRRRNRMTKVHDLVGLR